MLEQIKKNPWRIFGLVALVSFAIPMLIVAFVIISSPGKESVVFLENTPVFLGLFILIYYLLLIAGCVVWFIMRIIAILRLKNVTVKNELQHLNSQVNPHFFFNILNNLYGLVGTDPKKAQELILQLSDMMRYSIYEGQKETVTIAEEVTYLKNFISLHEKRYQKELDIKLKTDIADEALKVMPLLFIILVENAFKHGVEQLRKGAFVHINLKATKDSLRFEVVNNFDPEEIPEEAGLGLKNLKRRLTLRYPKQHTLTVKPVANVYEAVLILPKV